MEVQHTAVQSERTDVISGKLVVKRGFQAQRTVLHHKGFHAIAARTRGEAATQFQDTCTAFHNGVIVLGDWSGDRAGEHQVCVRVADIKNGVRIDAEAAVGHRADAIVLQRAVVEDEIGRRIAGGTQVARGIRENDRSGATLDGGRGQHDLGRADDGHNRRPRGDASTCDALTERDACGRAGQRDCGAAAGGRSVKRSTNVNVRGVGGVILACAEHRQAEIHVMTVHNADDDRTGIDAGTAHRLAQCEARGAGDRQARGAGRGGFPCASKDGGRA